MKPLITFALATYNQEHFVNEALEGAFSQTYSPLEIVISDDCSQDKTYQMVQSRINDYNGPHRVRINRNQQNLGLAKHLTRIFKISSGELIVFAAGDDISISTRVEQIYRCWVDSSKKVQAIFSQARIIDVNGNACGYALDEISPEMLSVEWMLKYFPKAYGSCLAFSRGPLETFGPIPTGILQEDLILPVRAALLGPLAYIEKPLVLYRRHQNNMWKTPGIDSLNAKQFTKNLKRHSNSRISIFRCWLEDVNTARTFINLPKELFDKYERLANEKLIEALFETKFMTSGVFKRLLILLEAHRAGIDIHKILEWGFMFILPRVYLAYISNSRKHLRKKRYSRIHDK